MVHYNNLIICSLIFGNAPLVSGDVEMKFETNNHPGPYRRYSKELNNVNPENLYGLDEAAFAGMTLNDPLLKLAYTNVFTQSLRNINGKSQGQLLYTEPTEAPALADMRRRGESVTPMLLKLLEENQETGFETSLLGKIDQVGTIPIDPFMEYARNLLKNRTQTMSASAAGSAAELLSRYGSREDADLLRWVMKERSYVADSVTRKLDGLLQRLNQTVPEIRPDLKSGSKTSEIEIDSNTNRKPESASVTTLAKPPSKMWIAWALLVIILIATLRLLFKSGIKRGR